MSTFEIKGLYSGGVVGKTWLPFTKIVESQNDKNAVEWVYSLMGSEHGLRRDKIRVEGVKAVE